MGSVARWRLVPGGGEATRDVFGVTPHGPDATCESVRQPRQAVAATAAPYAANPAGGETEGHRRQGGKVGSAGPCGSSAPRRELRPFLSPRRNRRSGRPAVRWDVSPTGLARGLRPPFPPSIERNSR